jgi:Stress responsive A/B Barrel Domain
VRLRFHERAQWDEVAGRFAEILAGSAVSHVDGAECEGTPVAVRHRTSAAVYRTLLLRVAPGTDEATVSRFEDDLRVLPRHVPGITAWQLSRVSSATGASRWTHVYEQEFAGVEALMGPYLMHPIHWAYVDRWFDPECPEVIVRERVCHSFCRCTVAVLS